MGITDIDYFYTLNPHKLQIIEKGYLQKKRSEIEETNAAAYTYGIYVGEALKSTVCNMFTKKGASPYKYPERPFEIDERTEEEKIEDALMEFREEQDRRRKLWRKKHNK